MSDVDFAKTHLRDHIASLIITPVSEGFWSIHSSAKDICERNRTEDKVIQTFQNMLSKIPDWSDKTLKTEVDRIKKVTKCNYLDDLLMGVFIAYMKSFASLQDTSGSTDIEIDFENPSLATFIHKLYVESARKLWQSAYLFKTDNVPSEIQARSRKEIENIINQCLEQVIRDFLPWESITRKYFQVKSQTQPTMINEHPTEKKSVSFGDDEDEDEDEERAPPLNISEEEASIEIPDIDCQEEDTLKSIEINAKDTLVLNL